MVSPYWLAVYIEGGMVLRDCLWLLIRKNFGILVDEGGAVS